MLVAAHLAACSDKKVQVISGDTADYGHKALQRAVDEFVQTGRTPEGYAQLAQKILAIRPAMDRSVAEEAELKLVVLALGPMQAVQQKTIAEQIEALALTVWPTLLADPIIADAVVLKRNPKPELMPRAEEDGRAYIQRLCGGPLAGDCKQVVPEYQGSIVSGVTTRRAMERVRNAVADCVMCGADPGWRDAVRSWEALDRQTAGWVHEIERRGHPDNWPIAGAAAETGATLSDVTALWREAEINAVGEVVIGGQHYTGEDRIAALRDLRGDSDTITLHLRPELSLAQVKGVIADAKRSGANRVAIVARAPEYPWDRRIYWLSDSGKTRVHLRPTDSLQLLLHTLDHVAGPGAVARVD